MNTERKVAKYEKAERLSRVAGRVPLPRVLEAAGLGARARCSGIVLGGRVTVNGRIAELGAKVAPSDSVVLDKRRLHPETEKVYLVINKPVGYLCSNSDSRGRPLLLDLLQDIPQRIFHVGRLDFRSSGLIFYTNDGEFAKTVSHPSSRIENPRSSCSSVMTRGIRVRMTLLWCPQERMTRPLS